jgi:hypothetical protein
VIVGAIIAAALVFFGYSITDAISKIQSGKFTSSVSTSSSSSRSSDKTSSKSGSSSGTSSKTSSAAAAIHGVFLPKSYLSDTAALNSFITQAKAAGINLAVIDLKAEDGIVNYSSKLSIIQGTAIIAKNAPDASVAARALSAAGITPAARICAFQDPTAPNILRGYGVMYAGNHSYNWLDANNTMWLNPYSPNAQQYIISLATEAVSLGYKQIFVDSLTFPTSGSPDTSGFYGTNLPTKEQCISAFTAALKAQVDAAGGKLSVIMPGNAAVGKSTPNIGQSQDIFKLSGDYISPNLCPSFFNPAGIQVGTATIIKPDLTPGNTVNTIAQYLKGQDGSSLSIALPILQAYTNTSIGAGNYKQYSSDDIKAEISALSSAGISNYMLYRPDGNYDFSALQ